MLWCFLWLVALSGLVVVWCRAGGQSSVWCVVMVAVVGVWGVDAVRRWLFRCLSLVWCWCGVLCGGLVPHGGSSCARGWGWVVGVVLARRLAGPISVDYGRWAVVVLFALGCRRWCCRTRRLRVGGGGGGFGWGRLRWFLAARDSSAMVACCSREGWWLHP